MCGLGELHRTQIETHWSFPEAFSAKVRISDVGTVSTNTTTSSWSGVPLDMTRLGEQQMGGCEFRGIFPGVAAWWEGRWHHPHPKGN